jgi:small-conductance mechanosensitive channel
MRKRLISYGYAAIILGLKVFLAAIAIAIGVVFIGYGTTGDPVVLGLIPPYIIIVVWTVIYYFIKRRN